MRRENIPTVQGSSHTPGFCTPLIEGFVGCNSPPLPHLGGLGNSCLPGARRISLWACQSLSKLVTKFSDPKIGDTWFHIGYFVLFPDKNGILGNVVSMLIGGTSEQFRGAWRRADRTCPRTLLYTRDFREEKRNTRNRKPCPPRDGGVWREISRSTFWLPEEEQSLAVESLHLGSGSDSTNPQGPAAAAAEAL